MDLTLLPAGARVQRSSAAQFKTPVIGDCRIRNRAVDQEALAIGRDRIVVPRHSHNLRLEQRMWRRRPKRVGVDIGGHQLLVRREVEQLAAVAAPHRVHAAAGGDTLFLCAGRKGGDVEFIGHVRNVAAVRRDAGLVLGERGAEKRPGCFVSRDRQEPQIPLGLGRSGGEQNE